MKNIENIQDNNQSQYQNEINIQLKAWDKYIISTIHLIIQSIILRYSFCESLNKKILWVISFHYKFLARKLYLNRIYIWVISILRWMLFKLLCHVLFISSWLFFFLFFSIKICLESTSYASLSFYEEIDFETRILLWITKNSAIKNKF